MPYGGIAVLFGSRTKPFVLTLGAATVLAIGGATVPLTALASDSGSTAEDPTTDPSSTPGADPSESPTPDPTPSDPPTSDPTDPPPVIDPPSDPPGGGTTAPSLTISMSLSSKTAGPGGSVTATVKVSSRNATAHNAQLRLSASGATVLSPGGLGDLGSTSRSVASLVTIPTTHGPGTVTVTAAISADHATTRRTSQTINVTTAAAAAANLGAPGMSGLPFTAPGSGLPGAPMTLPGLQPQLPLIGQPPAVAPKLGQPGTPTALRAASSPLGMDDTTYRLVVTQMAWLSALLVFMSVLLTQIRVKRRRRLRLGAHAR
jgi:hypothetical protein